VIVARWQDPEIREWLGAVELVKGGRAHMRHFTTAWLAIYWSQSHAVNMNVPVYIWDDDFPVCTVYPDGRVVITL